jgi:glutathione S-transferase
VPVLVHDGAVWTESIDIMRHLEASFPEPALSGPADDRWFRLVEDAHVPCRIVSHQFLFRARRQLSEAQLADLAARHRNQELIDFLAEFSRGPGFSFVRVRAAVRAIDRLLAAAEAALEAQAWLGGTRPGLADFAIAVTAHRMTYLDFPMAADYPRVADWYARLRARPQFQRAVIEPEAETFDVLLGR